MAVEVFNSVSGRHALTLKSIPHSMGAFKGNAFSQYSGLSAKSWGSPVWGLVELVFGTIQLAHLGSTGFRKRLCMVVKV